MTALLDIQALTKSFGSFLAVDAVSLSLERGEVLGFLGPNGAGKSTTMKMVAGFLSPTSGTALVDGFDVTKNPLAVKSRLGYLPEGAPLYGDMTPRQLLKFVGSVRGLSRSRLKERMEVVTGDLNIADVMGQSIETLSKGYKRRVGLAQALIHDPDVLILDEPTDGLDPNQKHEVRQLLKAISKDKAIVVSTHILEEVEAVCTRAVIIAHGRIEADATPRELFGLKKPDEVFRELTLGSQRGAA